MTWAEAAEAVFKKMGRIEMDSYEIADVAKKEGWLATSNPNVREALMGAMFKASHLFSWGAAFIYKPHFESMVAKAVDAKQNPKTVPVGPEAGAHSPQSSRTAAESESESEIARSGAKTDGPTRADLSAGAVQMRQDFNLRGGDRPHVHRRVPNMRVLAWNVDRATHCKNAERSRAVWRALLTMDPDIAMLQEVYNVPACVQDRYHVEYVKARYFEGMEAKFGTVVLARKSDWTIGSEVTWTSEYDWVNQIQRTFPGWLVGRQVRHKRSGVLYAPVSVYSPAFPIECVPDKTSDLCAILNAGGVDIGSIQLKYNSTLWFTEILWSLLKGTATGSAHGVPRLSDATNWIVGGDFNSSRLFDSPKNGGNGEIIARLNALGLLDCVFQHYGRRQPTWLKRGAKRPKHQLDYVYVNAPMLARLNNVAVGGNLPEDQKWLSDHAPVVCDFADS